jgi:hypothetical protein
MEQAFGWYRDTPQDGWDGMGLVTKYSRIGQGKAQLILYHCHRHIINTHGL